MYMYIMVQLSLSDKFVKHPIGTKNIQKESQSLMMGFDNVFNNDKNRRIERIEMVNLIIEAVKLISMDDPRF